MYPIECYPCWFIDSLSPCDVGLYGIMFRIQKLSRHRSRFCMRPILGLLRAPFISLSLFESVFCRPCVETCCLKKSVSPYPYNALLHISSILKFYQEITMYPPAFGGSVLFARDDHLRVWYNILPVRGFTQPRCQANPSEGHCGPLPDL